MEKWYHSIQDWHRFADAVSDLVEDYIRYSTEIDENDGIYVDENDNVSIEDGRTIADKQDFHPIASLILNEGGSYEVDFDRIQELTDKYIFVR